jgi:hypothetical protein
MSDSALPASPTPPPGRGLRTTKSALLIAAVSSIIALLFALMNNRFSDLPSELLISNAIGGCIWLFIEGIHRGSGGRVGIVTSALIGVPLGVILGGKLAALLGAHDVIGAWVRDPLNESTSIGVTLLFAISASAFVILVLRASSYRLELESERRRSAEAGRAQAIAELGLLQAQIEPHFLFNTLAHVQSAIDAEPQVGKAMLEHLIRYLRGTLRRSRVSSYTLAEEQELIESLLAIAAMRLGERLRYRVTIPEALHRAALPPLLLQPLVENAIKHGIEAAVDGGEIVVSGEQSGDALVLRVSDTGVGIAFCAPEGVGLANVRARLASLYGVPGLLSLHRNPGGGVQAELRLPLRFG